MPRTQPPYPPEFRQETVRLVAAQEQPWVKQTPLRKTSATHEAIGSGGELATGPQRKRAFPDNADLDNVL